MGYTVEFDALDSLYNSLSGQASEWRGALDALSSAMDGLVGSQDISGAGAESIRSYLSSVHGSVIPLLEELIVLHASNVLLYKRDYQSGIDTDLHAVISTDQVLEQKNEVSGTLRGMTDIDGELAFTLGSVRDIFPLSVHDISYVAGAHQRVIDRTEKLYEDITALENRHCENDFLRTEQLIESLKQFILERRSQSRNYMASFSAATLASSASFLALYQAHLAVESELSEKAPAIEIAIENENQRLADLQAEYEERQRKANTTKWIVTGVCVIGSIVAIAATGGAATPLVVGAISGVSGAVIAGTNNLADQYVEHGNLLENSDKIDWSSFGKSVAVGGVSGFVTGALGAGVSQAVTTGLSSTAAGSALLNSSNAFVRVGTGAAIGSASQISSGVVTRGAGTLITSGGDVDAALHDAFNLKSIAFDAAMGGVSGGIAAAKNPPIGKKIGTDDLDDTLLSTKPKNSPNPEKWIDEGGSIYVDGNGTWTYQAADGTHVCYTDGYPDFKRAGLVEQEVDIGGFSDSRSVDFSKANKISPKSPTTTWHHSEDGHTLEAVDTFYHKLFTHRGGFSITNHGG